MSEYNERLKALRQQYGSLIYENDDLLIFQNRESGGVTFISGSALPGAEATAPDGTPVSDLLDELKELRAWKRHANEKFRRIKFANNEKGLSPTERRAAIDWVINEVQSNA